MTSNLTTPLLLLTLVALNAAILFLQIADRRERRELIEQLIALHEERREPGDWQMPRLRTFEDEAS